MTGKVWNPVSQMYDPAPNEERCTHHARIPQLVRCELPEGHEGDHAGNRGRISAWSHRADLPSADPAP